MVLVWGERFEVGTLRCIVKRKAERKHAKVDEEHYEIKGLRGDLHQYEKWSQFDVEGMVGHAIVDTAATTGLIGEETLKKWKQ